MYLRILTLLTVFFSIIVPWYISALPGDFMQQKALQHMGYGHPWAIVAWIIWAIWMVYPIVLYVKANWHLREYM